MFDSDQVSVLSQEQMQSLDPEKRTIVEEKSQSTSDSDNDKGGGEYQNRPRQIFLARSFKYIGIVEFMCGTFRSVWL